MDIKNTVHPIDAGNLPAGYSVMSTGTGRLRYRAYYNRKPIGAPKMSVAACRRLIHEHRDNLAIVRCEPEVIDVDAETLARLRAAREEAGGCR